VDSPVLKNGRGEGGGIVSGKFQVFTSKVFCHRFPSLRPGERG